ncbi:hypothetical protein B5F39_07445 [Cloacibacillus sp. An23]|nr:hypothetical protein B5F39_07445 [Cloacibacillus sp. An23]
MLTSYFVYDILFRHIYANKKCYSNLTTYHIHIYYNVSTTRYSKGLRERAIKYLLSGHSYRETAKTFNVGTPALGQWKKMLEEQGDFQDKPCRKYFRKIEPKNWKNISESIPTPIFEK